MQGCRASVQSGVVGFSRLATRLLVFLQVGVAGLHSKGEWHLGSEIPVVLDLVVPDLQLPHAAAQLDILLVLVGLETGGGKLIMFSPFRFLSASAE